MNLKIAFDETMERHHRVLNKVAADIAGQLSDPELRAEAASLLTVLFFVEPDELAEIESLAIAVHETM